MNTENFPLVTVAIPVYNEERYIEGVLSAFLNQDYKGNFEILVCDGLSKDRTVSIVEEFSRKHQEIRLFVNKDRHQTFALNVMLEQAKGDIFLRADAHSEYASDYISKCVAVLQKSKAQNAGGAQRYLAKTTFQAAVAFANKSNFGSGNAMYKKGDFNGYVDTVYLGCFYTKTLREIGGFSTQNIQNQDTELNYRLQKFQDNAIYLSSEIKAYYYPRETLYKLWLQYYRYGKGRRVTHDQHKDKSKLRGQLPFLLFVVLLAVLFWNEVYFLGMISGILLLILLDTSKNVISEFDDFAEKQWRGDPDKKPGKIALIVLSTVAIVTMALAHAIGFLKQTTFSIFAKKK